MPAGGRMVMLLLSLVAAAAGAACNGRDDPGPRPRVSLSIAAAASMKPAMEELAAEFQRDHPDISVSINYGSSGSLSAQLRHRAPFDIFYSADTQYTHHLVASGTADPDSLRIYATGRLVLWAAQRSGGTSGETDSSNLTHPSISHVALANPRHAPYGRAAMEVLDSLGLGAALEPKLVLGESAEQAAQFVHAGAAQVAFLPLSLALAPAMSSAGDHQLISTDLHAPIQHAVVILSWTRSAETAAAFDAFVAGERGAQILRRHGLEPPEH